MCAQLVEEKKNHKRPAMSVVCLLCNSIYSVLCSTIQPGCPSFEHSRDKLNAIMVIETVKFNPDEEPFMIELVRIWLENGYLENDWNDWRMLKNAKPSLYKFCVVALESDELDETERQVLVKIYKSFLLQVSPDSHHNKKVDIPVGPMCRQPRTGKKPPAKRRRLGMVEMICTPPYQKVKQKGGHLQRQPNCVAVAVVRKSPLTQATPHLPRQAPKQQQQKRRKRQHKLKMLT